MKGKIVQAEQKLQNPNNECEVGCRVTVYNVKKAAENLTSDLPHRFAFCLRILSFAGSVSASPKW
jgi:hypothetical protein